MECETKTHAAMDSPEATIDGRTSAGNTGSASKNKKPDCARSMIEINNIDLAVGLCYWKRTQLDLLFGWRYDDTYFWQRRQAIRVGEASVLLSLLRSGKTIRPGSKIFQGSTAWHRDWIRF